MAYPSYRDPNYMTAMRSLRYGTAMPSSYYSPDSLKGLGTLSPFGNYLNSSVLPQATVQKQGLFGKMSQASRNQWNNTFGNNATTASRIGGGLAVAQGALQLAQGASGLAKANKSKYNGLKDSIRAVNEANINFSDMDTLADAVDSYSPLKTDYSWKDFYANGGCLTIPRPHKFSAGGRAAMGIGSNTLNGAAAGLQVGGPFGAAFGAAAGLGSGLFGFFRGKGKAKDMAANINDWSEEANDNKLWQFNSNLEDIKRRRQLGWDTAVPQYAYGGLMGLADSDTGAIDYGFMSDYLNMKNSQAQSKGNMISYLGTMPSEPMTFANGGGIRIKKKNRGKFTETMRRTGKSAEELSHSSNPLTRKRAIFALNSRKWKHGDGGFLNEFADNGDTFFALGGDVQTNGSDFTDGLSHINEGQSHEENPYSGVQMGIAPDGAPNLVEEGETIFNDYVFSNRIHPTKDVLKKFHMYSKGGKLTYADVSKRLEKEAKERPNDPISQSALKNMLEKLAEAQENQKAEEEAERARKAFEALSPEEQQQVLAQITAQQQAEEQPTEEVPVDENGNPVDTTAMQQPVQPTEEEIAAQQPTDEGVVGAEGGKLNHKFEKGGEAVKNTLSRLLNLPTQSAWDKWLKDNNVTGDIDWENIKDNTALMAALTKNSPALANAINSGYDFGVYTPSANNSLTFDFTHGGWGSEDYNAWNGSTDAAWKEAVEKGLVSEGMGSDEIGNALRQTDAYKRGTDWLKASEGNRLKYLQAIYNSTDAPQAARDYAARYVDANGWLSNAPSRAYTAIFEDPNSQGVRNTHPGTYWKTPDEVLRNATTSNFVVNDDGTVEALNFVPEGWTKDSTYSWATPDSDLTYNYYKRPAAAAPAIEKDVEDKAEADDRKIPYKNEKWRYAGLLGPAVGLGLWSAGIGRPDTGQLDAALESSGNTYLTDYKPVGDYLAYRPMDIWAQESRNQANARATDRGIVNNNATVGAKYAGLLANGYNSQLADAQLYRQAREYNDAQRQRVADFNRGTNVQNANAYDQAAQFNAEARNRNRQYRASLAADIARQRMAADQNWYNGLYGNISELFRGISDYGRENAQYNQLAALANSGVVGTPNSEFTTILDGRRRGTKSSRGGKLRKRKGLTF